MSPLDDQVRSALDRVLVSLKGHLEADLTTSASDIVRAVSEAQIRTAAEAAERAAAEVRLDADQQLSSLRDEFERERNERQISTDAEVAGLQRAIDELRAELASARVEIADAQRLREDVERQLADSQRNEEESRHAAEQSRRDVEAIQRDLDAARHTAEHAQGEIEAMQRDLDAARRSTEEHEREAEEAQRQFRRELDAAREGLERADRLPVGLRALDHASSLGDVLDTLTRLASHESNRAAVFLVRGDRLRGWRAIGFEVTDSILGPDMDANQAGLVGEVAKLGRGMEHANGDGAALPPFATGHGLRHAIALPVEVGGSVIAVLYADAERTDRPEEPRWPAILDVMARHAGRVLEAITVRHAAAIRAPLRASDLRRDHASSGGA